MHLLEFNLETSTHTNFVLKHTRQVTNYVIIILMKNGLDTPPTCTKCSLINSLSRILIIIIVKSLSFLIIFTNSIKEYFPDLFLPKFFDLFKFILIGPYYHDPE